MTGNLITSIEQITVQEAKNGRAYYSFWVRLNIGKMFLSISGWKYFPDTQTITTPSQGKGEGKFVNTVKTNPEFYNEVLRLALERFTEREEEASAVA